MKFFSLIPTIGLAVLGAVSVAAQQSSVVISDLGAVTVASGDLRDVVGNITFFNVLFEGHKVADGLTEIVGTVQNALTQFDPTTPPYNDDVAGEVVEALTLFVRVHQLLLSTIIGKHGILTGFAPGVACALRELEGIVDAFAFALISLIPTRHNQATDQQNALDQALQNAIDVYGKC
ncbi:hypothetical protein OH77DRAFT_1518838 [Trametes cingulata]|nr:hypothetical protein OH77DRAFT_1518838 [Trametes cingulata]